MTIAQEAVSRANQNCPVTSTGHHAFPEVEDDIYASEEHRRNIQSLALGSDLVVSVSSHLRQERWTGNKVNPIFLLCYYSH